jgi:hypothetical protein
MWYSLFMAVPSPQTVISLAEEITRLEAQLAEAQRRWNLLFGVGDGGKKPRTARPQGLPSRILQFLSEHPGVQYRISDVARSVGEGELQVGRVLYRLGMMKKISNPERGRYAGLELNKEDKTEAPGS